jgi:thiamine kinase-like enzyme
MDTPVDSDQLVYMWDFAEKNIVKPEYRAMLPKWLLNDPANLQRVFTALGVYERSQKGPYSIVHGDAHQGNTYVRPSGERIWVDWQLVRKGRPWRDISYFILGSLTIEERRANERRLIDHYRGHLAASGAQGVPSADEIWDSYRRWPIYGCQSWIANMDEWGQIGFPMTERFFTALEDLDTVKLLGVTV